MSTNALYSFDLTAPGTDAPRQEPRPAARRHQQGQAAHHRLPGHVRRPRRRGLGRRHRVRPAGPRRHPPRQLRPGTRRRATTAPSASPTRRSRRSPTRRASRSRGTTPCRKAQDGTLAPWQPMGVCAARWLSLHHHHRAVHVAPLRAKAVALTRQVGPAKESFPVVPPHQGSWWKR